MTAFRAAGRACGIAVIGVCAGVGDGSRMRAQTPVASPQTVESLAWLSGCWSMSQSGGGTIEEHWTKPAGGTLVGMGRTVRGGQTAEYEFLLIKAIDGRLGYIAKPSGQPEGTFIARTLTETEVVFENLAHDFPQRVIYRRDAQGVVGARVEGQTPAGQVRGIDYPYGRCR